MPNLSQRLSKLQPQLLELRHGKGAHVLPPAPAPQLTHVYLRYPRRTNLRPDARTDGAHQFHGRHLPRLKYYNPTLKIDVKNDGNTHAMMKLVLQFESTDPAALRAIAQKSTKPKQQRRRPQAPIEQQPEQTQAELEAEAAEQSPNWRDAPSRPEAAEPTASKQPPPQKKHSADDDEVILKAQPGTAIDSSSAAPVYTRSVTLPINRRPHWEIWQWFKKRTGAEAVPMLDADRKMRHRINEEAQQREKDKELGLIIGARVKQEREALAKAKKAADAATAQMS